MVNLILQRFVSSTISLLGVIFISFALLNFIPGSPVYEMIGSRGDQETIRRLNEQLQLGKPLHQRFLHYLENTIRLDLGRSFFSGEEVSREILERAPRTFLIAGLSMLLGSILGIAAGAISSLRPHGWIDRTVISVSVLGISTPVFWAGIVLVLVFSIYWPILPSGGYRPGEWEYLVLPVLALGMRPASFVARLTRSELLEVFSEPYITTARAKGMGSGRVLLVHALKNALVPVIHLIGMDLGTLLGGAAIVEIVFNFPGIGYYGLRAINQRDYPVILGVVLFSAACFILVNLIVDIVTGLIDPRAREAS